MTPPSRSDHEELPGFRAVAPKTRHLVQLAIRAARRAATILVTGETGSGKGRLARAMHDLASGEEAPFVVIDCATLPEGVAESELFGHEADAFSGASGVRHGRFEIARGGTVLLDRVEDLPLELQGKLLRVLQERTFERVGGHRTVKVEARVVATSSADLSRLVREGRVREDLYYRLDVVHLVVPPLRERAEDVAALVREFVAEARVSEASARLDPEVLSYLASQPWPGNVRQLRNVVERALTLGDGAPLSVETLAPLLEEARPSPDRAVAELAELRLSLSELEALYIARVMRSVGGRMGKAADVLGIHRKTLLEKRKRHGLD